MKIDLTKQESLLTPQQPARSAKLSSRACFMQEKNYHTNAFNDLYSITDDFIDFNYENYFYGKLDTNSLGIYPKQGAITQIKNISNSVFVLNFVNDAITKFLDRWDKLKRQQKVFDDGVLYNLSPVSGFEDIRDAHNKLIDIYEQKLHNFIRSKNYSVHIKDLKSFVNVFSKFVDAQTPLLPITLSFFNVSKFFDFKGSGLVIDFSSDEKNTDQNKINKWIKSPNFELYKNTLEYYGFSLEKNTPWRIVANIDSISMKKFMEKYQINKDILFEVYFNKLNLIELDIYKNQILNLYKNLIKEEPELEISKSEICNNEIHVKKSKIKRTDELILAEDLWLRLYAFSRAREINAEWTQSEFDHIVKNCERLKKNVDLSVAMNYLEKKISKVRLSKRKNRNFKF